MTTKFNFETLKLPQNFSDRIGVKKLLTSINVRKPNKQEFFRVRAEEEFRRDLALIEFEEDSNFYAVAPELVADLSDVLKPTTLFTAITRQGTPFLIPVRLPGPDGISFPAWDSRRAAVERAMDEWLRVQWNRESSGYDIFVAPALKDEPAWPDMSLNDLLKLAFQGRLIESQDHLVIRKLKGLA